jgi:hypothetical protein
LSSNGTDTREPLACPTCARRFPLSERFCPDCGTPLAYVGRADEEPVTEAGQRAARVRPEYVGGELVKVGFARNLAEAELIQGMLLEEGIPSSERRSRGFDVPDFLAGGPRDILVPQAAYEAARQLLATTGEHPVEPGEGGERPLRLLVGVLIAFALAVLVVWLLYQLAT